MMKKTVKKMKRGGVVSGQIAKPSKFRPIERNEDGSIKRKKKKKVKK